MPRLVHSVPRYRKHKPTGQAIVEINGERHYLGLHGSRASRLEYDRLITEWLASGRSNASLKPSQELQVDSLLVDYLRHCRTYYGTGPSSEWRSFKAVARRLNRLYGRTPAAQFGPRQFKAVRERLVADGVSRSYVNKSMGRIIRMFKWAVEEARLPVTIPQSLAMVRGLRSGKSAARETDPVEPVDDAVVEATLPYLPEVVADMVRIQRLTGMRPGEVCMLCPCEIDRAGEVWEFRPRRHKTAHRGRQRVICIGPQAQAILFRYLARDAEAHCFRPSDSEAKRLAARNASRKTPLSCGNTRGTNRKRKPKRSAGESYSTGSYGRAISRACDFAWPVPEGIVNDVEAVKIWKAEHRWAPNQLRHSAGTEIRRKFGLEAAQVTLGHSRADVTQVYAERDQALATRVAMEVG